jgi:hypothetical protein
MANRSLEKNNSCWIAGCCLAVILSLYTVGLVTGLILRHLVQTAPLWIGVALGIRRSELAKWVAMPFFAFWLCIMTFIWLYLLGWARIVNGHFSPIEIAMTLIVGVASIAGFVSGLRLRTGTSAVTAVAIVLLSFASQVAAMAISLMPAIAHR